MASAEPTLSTAAVMFDGGRFTTQDEAQAALWYARAASHGLPRAQYNLGQLYDAGEGVPKNHQAAAEWYEAASSKIPAATVHLTNARKNQPAAGAINKALATPQPYSTSDTWLTAHSLELAWIEPQQPVQVRYYVSVVSMTGQEPVQLFEGYAPASALVVQLPDHAQNCAWRVYAVDATGARYAASRWQRLKNSAIAR